ncbi:hypothetical protein [Methylorubrum populi]|uniref:hypothetical protein n=1 Tax=Methylorubrum populi TaxID=223967 RepID=UPI000DB3E861|nr:hypothetical protein [Methylorubrum populi]PZP68372.1 MAG: hypothetical protein DI590_16620 [Methylorubrum populi]
MTTRKEAWWVAQIRSDGTLMEPELGEVSWEGEQVESILLTGMERDYSARQVYLIERIAPPRAKAADLPAVGSFHG